jgi:hypothetical protein
MHRCALCLFTLWCSGVRLGPEQRSQVSDRFFLSRFHEGRTTMKLRIILALLLLLVVIVSGSCRQKPATNRAAQQSTPPPAELPLTSPPGFTAALERRWPLQNIVRYCTHERRSWNGCQNLVTIPRCEKNGKVWEEDLFKGAETGFDRVWWYATVCGDKIETYSLNARRGADFWNIEISTLERLATPPVIEPSPKNPCFQDEHDARSTSR